MGDALQQPARRSPARDDSLGPALAAALSHLLPRRHETALLKALLHRGESARDGWAAFCAAVPDVPSAFRLDSGAWKRLSPLLLVALRESAIEAEAPLRTVLRTASLREELRARVYREIAGTVLGVLHAAGLRFLVLRGAALSDTVYRSPVFRHAHDVDVLVAADDAAHAAEILTRAGLRASRPLRDDQGRQFEHPSGLPVLVHRRFYRLSYYRTDFDALWMGAAAVRVAGVEARVPAHGDHLLHVLEHAASSPGRATLQWATDAWMLIHGPAGVEWTTFPARVADSRLELPVHTMLDYLAHGLDGAVPRVTLEQIANLAARAPSARRDVALFGARQKPVDATSDERRAPAWRTRWTLLRWRTFPSPEFMRWRYGACRAGAPLPTLYLRRMIDYAARRVRRVRAGSTAAV